MISFKNFALRRGERLLLSDVDLTLHAGWRVGVIGRNGCGKSSLFAALLREVEPDKGDLDLPNRVRVASVAQETPSIPDAALDFVLDGDPVVSAVLRAERIAMENEDWEGVAEAHQKLAEINGYDATARAGRLLHGLGFAPETHSRAVSEFSGGWRVRLNLARALMCPSDLLLLDEPTNHLDMDAVLWLEQWLLKYEGTLLIISHDREFLDGLCTHTLHLHQNKAKLYSGDYTSFEHQRAEHLRLQQIAHEKEQAEREHLQKFIDRFKAKASKAKQAQSRMKRLAKLSGTEAVRAEREIRIDFDSASKIPHSLLSLRHVDAGYGEDARILADVGFALEEGDRIGLLGPNGAGKSTLVKTLVGELPLMSGERIAHPDLRIGYFAQHTVESLHEGQSPVDHFRDLSPQTSTQDVRDFLGRWNFPGDRAFENVDGFSGGERARLALAMIAFQKPNVLLLDEPTNHLDLEMREALAEALAVFDGAIVMVSHDRHLIGLVCETFWRVADGKVEEFNGDLDQYAAWLRSRSSDSGRADKTDKAEKSRKLEPSKPKPSGDERQLKRDLQQLEQKLEKLRGEKSQVDAQLNDADLYAKQAQRATELGQQQSRLGLEIEQLESHWLELYERLEQV